MQFILPLVSYIVNEICSLLTPNLFTFLIFEFSIIKFGSGTLTAGDLYFLHTDGAWYATDSDTPAYGGSQLLAVAVGTSPTSNGMLIRGITRVASGNVQGTPAVGKPLYVSEDHTAQFDFTAPSGNGDYVRILGYCLATTGGDILLLFNPSHDWVEVSA